MGLTVARKHRVAAREVRRNTIVAYVLSGWRYRDIATALSISLGTVSTDMNLVMKRWRTEQVQQVNERRQIDLARIDRALSAIWHKVEAGDVHAIDRMIKLIQERAKLLGLYAPEKVANTLPDGSAPPPVSEEYSDEFIRNVCTIMAEYGILTGATPAAPGHGTAAESYQR